MFRNLDIILLNMIVPEFVCVCVCVCVTGWLHFYTSTE